jgi:glycosyltransferase involved in cell wall biosynthesis
VTASSITVAIPTHNRPRLLREALASVERQSVKPAEVIVVDDASDPPVDLASLTSATTVPVRLFRNEKSRGLPWNRNKAATEAAAAYVLHLDDDDLLAPATIETASKLLDGYPQTELIFLGGKAFGRDCEYFNRVQPEGTRRLLGRVSAKPIDAVTFAITDGLPIALLKAVPQSFQHPIVAKPFWSAVTDLRNRAYAYANGLANATSAFELITGPLRDSEWSIYASFLAKRVFLMDDGLYRVRCEGQAAVSRPEQRQRHVEQGLLIKRTLCRAARQCEPLFPFRRAIEAHLRDGLFSAAYYYHSDGRLRAAWRCLGASARRGLTTAQLKLAARMLLSELTRLRRTTA